MYMYSASYNVCYYLFAFIILLFKKCVFNQGPMEDHLLVNGLPCINIINK